MSFYQDKQIRGYVIFLLFYSLLIVIAGFLVVGNQMDNAKEIYLSHDNAIAASLLEQGVSKEIIAKALTNKEVSDRGKELLSMLKLEKQTKDRFLPYILELRNITMYFVLVVGIFLISVLFMGTWYSFWRRKQLYLQAEQLLRNYINGDYSCHLPQNREGAIFQIFASVDQLATMLQAKNEEEQKRKEFLKNTISDISHQLKTPLAALAMYQEIIECEPDNIITVKEFSAKMGNSLKRMEQLIQSMLKITRLDTKCIVFEKKPYQVSELVLNALNELTTRAKTEQKDIIIKGSSDEMVTCDMEWTSEAIGNIVKNALDHTTSGGVIRISWERSLAMLRIWITDNGKGIAPEDLHHIFKRFYRSKNSMDIQGLGLGLSLVKSIIDGQDGMISVQSDINEGTTFTLSFLTEM